MPKRGAFVIETIARLKRGVSGSMAREFLAAEARRLHADSEPRLISLQSQLAGPVRQACWILAGMILLVLLAACANVAQLLLSRTSERHQEMVVRSALGASQARLLQQLMTEASALTFAGAVLGLLVACWVSRLASSVAPAQLSTQVYSILDGRVLCFAAVLALTMGVATGALPVWRMGQLQRSRAIRRLRFGLISVQTALALCLITSSLTMGRTFLELIHANLGFRVANVVTLSVSLQGSRYHVGRNEWEYYSEALDSLRAVPGVQSVGAVNHLPLATNEYMAFPFKLDSGQTVKLVAVNAVTQGYFQAMGTPLLAGRDFAADEMRHSEPAVIVNEAFAQAIELPGGAVVGRQLIAPWTHTPYRIVGLVAAVRNGGPASGAVAQIYWPIQEEPPAALTLVAKVDGTAEDYLARCRHALILVDRSVPIYDVKTLDQRLADVLSRPRFYTMTTLFLTMLTVLLAAVGIFGTAVQSIMQRRKEMGIRVAIGASYGRIRNMVVRECMLPIICGAALGMALSIELGRYVQHLWENAFTPDGWMSVEAAGLIFLTGLITAWIATRRALKIDPMEAIRSE